MEQMNLENLRRSWQAMQIELEKVKDQNRRLTERIFNNQARSVRSSVIRKYRLLCIIGIIYTPLMPLICIYMLHMDLLPTILMSVFFPLSVVINGSVLFKTMKIHPTEMTLKEMMIAFTNLQIHRSRCRILAYAIAVPILAGLLYYLYETDCAMFIGGAVGGIVGVIVGVNQDLKVSRQIREMRQSLAEELEEDD